MGANSNQAEVLVPGHAGAAADATQAEHTANAMRSTIQEHLSGPGTTGKSIAQAEDLRAGTKDTKILDLESDKTAKILPDWQTGKEFSGDKLPKFGIFDGKNKITEPTPEEVKQAQGALDGQISGLISPQDKQTLKGMQDSLLTGDIKGLASSIAGLQGDPARLRAFVDETNKNLNEVHAGMKLALDKAGNVVVYGDGSKGVEISPKGDVTVRGIEHGKDGSITMTGEVLNADGSKVFRGLANDAVNAINSPKLDEIGYEPWLQYRRGEQELYSYPRIKKYMGGEEEFRIMDQAGSGHGK